MDLSQVTGPTQYEEVNSLLLVMLKQIQTILGQQFIGFYLYGSLSLGDFDPSSSDIDFIIVTAEKLSEEVLEQLRDMHADIASSNHPYAHHLEGSNYSVLAKSISNKLAISSFERSSAASPTVSSNPA